MLKNITVLLLMIILSEIGYSKQVPYKIGDTLNVFTISGLKLRNGASLSSRILASMKLGDKVVIKNDFLNDNKYSQNIEGFAGHWVKVKFDTIEGFAFDGFLSSLPIPSENLIKKNENIKTKEEIEADRPYQGQEIETALQEYIKTEFYPICESVEYYNGSDGEGYHFLGIQKLNRGFTRINHEGWEASGTELLMPEIRLSEIKNLIILLAYRSRVNNKLFEEIKSSVMKMPEEKIAFQEILHLEMFWINVKFYPSEDNKLKWAIEMNCASS